MIKRLFRKITLLIAPRLIYIILRILWWSTSKKLHYNKKLIAQRHLFISWHGELLFCPPLYHVLREKPLHVSAIVSQHFDGEIIAKVLALFDIKSLRGSSSKGGSAVFRQGLKALHDNQELLLTPDGPRGPRHTLHEGIIALAQASKLPVCVVTISPNRYWQLKSWDKFMIPKPFSTIDCHLQSLSLENLTRQEATTHIKEAMLRYAVS